MRDDLCLPERFAEAEESHSLDSPPTNPKQILPHGFTSPLCELDVRPGGAILIHMRGVDDLPTVAPLADHRSIARLFQIHVASLPLPPPRMKEVGSVSSQLLSRGCGCPLWIIEFTLGSLRFFYRRTHQGLAADFPVSAPTIAVPTGVPHPVQASQPVAEEYAPLLPLVMS